MQGSGLGQRTGKSVLRWGCPLKCYGALSGLGVFVGRLSWGVAPGYHLWASLGPWMMARHEMGGRVWEGLWGEGRVRSLAVPGLFGAGVIGERRAGAQRSQGRVGGRERLVGSCNGNFQKGLACHLGCGYGLRMKSEFTAIIEPAPEGGFWAICPEIPGANGQGETVEETKQNLIEAIELLLEDRGPMLPGVCLMTRSRREFRWDEAPGVAWRKRFLVIRK